MLRPTPVHSTLPALYSLLCELRLLSHLRCLPPHLPARPPACFRISATEEVLITALQQSKQTLQVGAGRCWLVDRAHGVAVAALLASPAAWHGMLAYPRCYGPCGLTSLPASCPRPALPGTRS